MANDIDKWLAGQTDVATEGAKEGEKVGRMDFEDGTYICQIVQSKLSEDKNENFGAATRYAFLEGQYFGEAYFQWQGFQREDAWKWFSVWARSCGKNFEPQEIAKVVRATKEDLFGLVAERTVVKILLKTSKYTDKVTNEEKTAQNFRVLKVLEHDAVAALVDPADYVKDAKKTKEKPAAAKPGKPAPKATEKPKESKPEVADNQSDGGEDDPELQIGMKVKFSLTEGKGAKKTTREVIATIIELDEVNEIIKVKEDDDTEHELGTDEIEELIQEAVV